MREEAAGRGHVQPAGRCCCSRFPAEVLNAPHGRRQKRKASSLGSSRGAAAVKPCDSATMGRLDGKLSISLLAGTY